MFDPVGVMLDILPMFVSKLSMLLFILAKVSLMAKPLIGMLVMFAKNLAILPGVGVFDSTVY